jgi:hypothetical protein
MTLNITCVGHGYVLQAADGRLSVDGRAVDGWWAKQIVLGCRDGVLVITWTGIGSIRDEPVDMWLAAKLCGRKAPEGSTGDAVRMLEGAADELVAGLPAHSRRHTFVVTGHSMAGGRWRPLVWYVSNCLDDYLRTVGCVLGSFRVRPGPRIPRGVRVTGREDAVPPQTKRALRKLLRPTVPPRRLLDTLARVINNVASKPMYREVVSQNSVSVLLEQGKRPRSVFYPFDGDPVTYMPALVWHAGGTNVVAAGGQQSGGLLGTPFCLGWPEGMGFGMDIERAAGFPCDMSRTPVRLVPNGLPRAPKRLVPGGRS